MATTTILRLGLAFAFTLCPVSALAQSAQPTPALSEQRSVSLTPMPAEPSSEARTTFRIDPVADVSIVALSLGFAVVLQAITSTGEIHPQQIAPDFDRSQLLAIDRATLTRTPSHAAHVWSSAGVFIAGAYAVVDPILTGFREHSRQAALVDFVLYAESMSLTFAMTNMVKIAVRRPRPIAYVEAEDHRDDPNYSNVNTDSALSFFSSHASTTAAVGATATYLAFARSKGALRPWLTLGFATALTAVVSIGRVASGKHFPTDVIAGSIAGAGVGILVPHFHRSASVEERRVWVAFNPARANEGEGGNLTFSGNF